MNITFKNLQIFRITMFAFLLLPFYFLLFTSPSSAAHRYHTSLTRMDYNAEGQNSSKLRFSFSRTTSFLFWKDVRKSGLTLKKRLRVDKIILKYLNQNFVFKTKKTRRKN